MKLEPGMLVVVLDALVDDGTLIPHYGDPSHGYWREDRLGFVENVFDNGDAQIKILGTGGGFYTFKKESISTGVMPLLQTEYKMWTQFVPHMDNLLATKVELILISFAREILSLKKALADMAEER